MLLQTDIISQIDWAVLSRLLPEAIIVVLFIWFSLERDKRTAAEEKLRAEARIEADKKRDATWQAFLREERAWRAAASREVAQELNELAKIVSNTNALLIAHDAATRIVQHRAPGAPEDSNA